MTALTADDISLTQTCGACPEQYDAYDPDGKQVGYLRLRHGYFSVDMPDAGGTEVYGACPQGDGIFDPDERDGYLRTARERIAEHLNAAAGETVKTVPMHQGRRYATIVPERGPSRRMLVAHVAAESHHHASGSPVTTSRCLSLTG